MDFAPTERARDYTQRVAAFISAELRPVEPEYHQLLQSDQPAALRLVDQLKESAKGAGLWNLFLPDGRFGAGLSNADYAPVAEMTGRAMPLAPEVFNCNAPDTGNAEVLVAYGSEAQQERWLTPLLAGTIRSAFCMTEPDVASSDASNMAATAIVTGDEVVVNGTK